MPGHDLRRYTSRLARQWLADAPDERHRRIEASMLFLDLSGFTSICERLNAHGPAGTEAITDLLDATFGALLDDAAELGGDLLAFGGDALLLAFDGPAHPRRAASAAVRLRRLLRHDGPIDTLAGPVRLGLTAGLHTGVFDVFLVGGSSRQLVVAGPESDLLLDAELSAARNQIAVTDVVARTLPASWTRPGPTGPVLTSRAGQWTPAPGPEATNPDVDASPLLPTALRSHFESGGGAPRHRPTAVAFLTLDDVSGRVATDPVAAATDLDTTFRIVQDSADEHKVALLGVDVYPGAVKVTLTAGVPVSEGDDTDRLVAALLPIVTDAPIPARAGVNRGRLYAGTMGGSTAAAYSVIADTVNLAARLMSIAARGEVVVSPEVIDSLSVDADASAGEPFVAKGRSVPTVPWRVRSLGQRRSTDLATMPPSWEQAVDALVDDLVPARTGRAIALDAPAGSGGTIMADAVVARCPGAIMVRPSWSDQFRPNAVLAEGDEPAAGTVLVVDDHQWLDAASMAQLDRLARRARWSPVSILALGRVPIESPLFDQRGLPTASDEELLDLIRSAAPTGIRTDDARRLVELAAGRPPIAVALARAALYAGGLPESVEELGAAVLDRLEPDDRSLVMALAVAGSEARFSTWEALTGWRRVALESRLDALGGVVEADGDRVQIATGLIRTAAYEGLARSRRRHLHDRMADLLLSTADADDGLIAHHLEAASRLEEAATYARRAGARTLRAAPALAVAHLERAVRCSTGEVRSEAEEDLVLALLEAGRHDDAVATSVRVRRRVEDPLRSARLLGREATALRQLGQLRASARRAERARAIVDDLDGTAAEELRISLRFERVLWLHNQGRLEEAEAAIHELPWDGLSKDRRATVLFLRSTVVAESGRLEESADLARSAVEAFDDAGDALMAATARSTLGAILIELGRAVDGEAETNAALVEFERAGAADAELIALANLAEIALDLAKPDDARTRLARARALNGVVHSPEVASFLDDLEARLAEPAV